MANRHKGIALSIFSGYNSLGKYFNFSPKFVPEEVDNGQLISQDSRTAHISHNSAQNNFPGSAPKRQGLFCARSACTQRLGPSPRRACNLFTRKTSQLLYSCVPLWLFVGAALVSCDPPAGSSSTPPTKAWCVTTFAGNGADATRDGTGTAASFQKPNAITQDADKLYVLNTDGQIRTVDKSTAEVTTIVQGSAAGGYVDGNGTAARFKAPSGIAISGTTLYIADTGNNRIRTVAIGATAADTTVGTLAGSGAEGTTDAVGAAAQFDTPTGVAVIGTTLYVADNQNHRIRSVDISSGTTRGTVQTLAGSTYGVDDGVGTNAKFAKPLSMTASGTTLYVTGQAGHVIRAIEIASKRVSTLAGNDRVVAGFQEGTGKAARFNSPRGMALSGNTLYVADSGNHRIRAVDIASGQVRTIAGGDKGYKDGIDAQFNSPSDITISGNTLYVVDRGNFRIRKREYALCR